MIPGSGISLGEGTGDPLQYSCLGNPMDRAAWRATVLGVTRESDIVTKQQQRLYIYYIIFIHSAVDGHLGCLLILAMVNNVALNISVSFQVSVFGFFSRYIPRSRISGSLFSTLGFLRNLHILFHSGCINLNSHR